MYGTHPVRAALANPRRKIRQIWSSDAALESLADTAELAAAIARLNPIQCDKTDLDRMAGDGVHQGVIIEAEPLPPVHLGDLFSSDGPGLVVALDQVTDPQNAGAIFRSAAAFGARGVILTDRNAPGESGAMAKAAAGALDIVPSTRVANLAQSMEIAKKAGFWCIGLDADADGGIGDPMPGERLLLVLGAEGSGLRRLTRERCDSVRSIPMAAATGSIDSLNVSASAAIALYCLSGALRP
jgi:23S rRNA (guanosine2251-2'-O)-methyltransferase